MNYSSLMLGKSYTVLHVQEGRSQERENFYEGQVRVKFFIRSRPGKHVL